MDRAWARRERAAWLGAAVMVVAMAGGGVSAFADEARTAATTAASAVPAEAAAPRVVTLVTGDRVIADPARQRYEFRPAAGRERVSHRGMSVGGRQFVIPGDARVLVASGRVDLRLFDVTGLLDGGADGALVVTGDGGTRREPMATAEPGRRWAELTEVSPVAGGVRLGSRRLRAGVHAMALDGVAPARAHGGGHHELTFSYRNRHGAPSTDASTFVLGIDNPAVRAFVAPGPDSTATVRLPAGRYLVESSVDTPRPGEDVPATSVLLNAELTVERDTRVRIEAAAAQPVSVSVPDPAAIGVGVHASYERAVAWGPAAATVGSPDVTALFTAHDGPTVPDNQLDTALSAFFARPGPDGTATDSPLVYATSWRQRGRLLTGLRKRVTEAELSTVRAEHGTVASGRRATKSTTVSLRSSRFGQSIDYTATPFARTERYAGTVRWANELADYAPGGDPAAGERDDLATQTQSPTSYRPGRRYAERWNLAPFWADPQVRRAGDTITAGPSLHNDQAGRRQGTSAYRRARVVLYRAGQPVGESDRLDHSRFTVPAGSARYRLTAEAERGFTELAAKATATWTFSSAHVDGGFVTLPLLSVRYAPPVDLHGQAPAGAVVAMPVHVQRGAPGAAVRSLAVDASYDGGTTWRPVRLTGTGDRRLALVEHPPGPGLVSLHARAADTNGNTVEHTVVNAYRLRPPPADDSMTNGAHDAHR